MCWCFRTNRAMSCEHEAHSHSHGHAHDHHEVEDPEGESLFRLIDLPKVRCLNEAAAGSARNILRPFATKADTSRVRSRGVPTQQALRSESGDPELLLFVP